MKDKLIILAAGKPHRGRTPSLLQKPGLEGRVMDWVLRAFGKNLIEPHLMLGYSNENYSTTNMVASLFCASKYFDSKDDILITYGDIIYEKKVIESLIAYDSPISLTSDSNWEEYWRVRMDDPLKDAESFKVDKFNNIFEIGKKPTSYNDIEGQYMGIIRIKSDFTSKVFNFYKSLDRNKSYDGQTFDNMYMTTFIQKLIDYGFNVNPVFVENGWLEIDTIKDLEIYKNLEREGKLSKFCNIN